ncbi:MAG: hypothetical protein OEW18_10985, partial [Candidatus Aminicenantes bacterium]|nr:hypothetical protein [Candidatus Aminicenantes bacterium]
MKIRGRLYVLILGICVIALGVQPWAATADGQEENPTPSPGLRLIESTDLETFVDGVMAAELKAGQIAGATFVFVKDGSILLAKGYGYADVKKR